MPAVQPLHSPDEQPPEIGGHFAEAVFEGLSKKRKSLPCQYFYDARGSALFEEITRLPEYYPTRTEAGILAAHADEMTAAIGPGELLVEFGSGSSLKTEILLDRVAARVAYVPVDVSPAALDEARQRLATRYPGLDVRTIVADFSQPLQLPDDLAGRRKTGFFPGSTIGNLTRPEARKLLAAFRQALGNDGRLIIGIDLKKDAHTLIQAYNDEAGVTAAFNLNLIRRINREIGGTIDETDFRHEAIYEPREGRIEMHLVSRVDHDVEIAGRRYHFGKGESIHTESSHKYTVTEFRRMAEQAGWQPRNVWTDERQQFSVHELAAGPDA